MFIVTVQNLSHVRVNHWLYKSIQCSRAKSNFTNIFGILLTCELFSLFSSTLTSCSNRLKTLVYTRIFVAISLVFRGLWISRCVTRWRCFLQAALSSLGSTSLFHGSIPVWFLTGEPSVLYRKVTDRDSVELYAASMKLIPKWRSLPYVRIFLM